MSEEPSGKLGRWAAGIVGTGAGLGVMVVVVVAVDVGRASVGMSFGAG